MSKKKKVEIEPFHDGRPWVLYKRVSTAEQGDSRLGLMAQETFAKMVMGRDPIEIFTEVHTGTKLKQCKELWTAIELCKQNNYLLVVARYDRFRNCQEALEILDTVGSGNLFICDLPTTDRFVLTIMFAVAEKQAMAIRVNTQVAMAERKRQIKEQGGFMSKNGNWITHFGHKKGYHNPHFSEAGAKARADAAEAWRMTSALFLSVKGWYLSGMSRQKMVALANKLYEEHPDQFGTRQGGPLTEPILCKYIKIIDHETH